MPKTQRRLELTPFFYGCIGQKPKIPVTLEEWANSYFLRKKLIVKNLWNRFISMASQFSITVEYEANDASWMGRWQNLLGSGPWMNLKDFGGLRKRWLSRFSFFRSLNVGQL